MQIVLVTPTGAFDHQASFRGFASFRRLPRFISFIYVTIDHKILTSWWVIGTRGAKRAVMGGEKAEVGEEVVHPVRALHPLHPAVQTLQPATWRGLTDGTGEEKV